MGMLTWLAHRHWANHHPIPRTPSHLKLMVRGAIFILLLQVLLGGWTSTNYAALACTDFPTCHGHWIPEMDFDDAFHLVRELGQSANGGNLTLASLTAIQWTHRIGALITFIYLTSLIVQLIKLSAFRNIALLLLCLLSAQVMIGIANLILHLPLVLAVLHNLGAALLVITTIILNSKITEHQHDHAKT